MSQVESKRHIVFSLVSSVTKHHTLVACALVHRVFTFYATVDIRTLFVYSRKYATRIALKHVFALGVTNLVDYLTRYTLQIDIRFGFHFSCQHYLTGSYQCFASYFRTGVVSQQFVKHSVGNLIRHFVGVSFRHRFGCE